MMGYEYEKVIETQANSNIIKEMLEIRSMMIAQGLAVPANLTNSISKELFILAVDTDQTFKSVYTEYTKDTAKHVMATVTNIK